MTVTDFRGMALMSATLKRLLEQRPWTHRCPAMLHLRLSNGREEGASPTYQPLDLQSVRSFVQLGHGTVIPAIK